MNAVNAVQMFILIWTFYAVCQADDDFIVSCDDVTGSVGNEVTFTCRVSLQPPECCIKMYMFQYAMLYNDLAICKEEPPVNPCDHSNSFTCRYTPATAMTEKFRFFVQTNCGRNTTEFTVNIPVPSTPEIVTEAPSMKERNINQSLLGTSLPDTAEDPRSKYTVTAVVVGFFILIIIVIMTVIRNKKPSFNTSCRFQKRMFLGLRHDEDNSNRPEHVVIDSAV
ncbi:uncharacterized protein LOC131520761 [Onychostoma macrolepis]|nr:uncharacterized protein LOC131520761 [Onychostoma macrolepis]